MKESIQDSINPKETKKVFIDLKVKLEEAKMIEETLRKQLEEKEKICRIGKWNSLTQRETTKQGHQAEQWK